MIERRLDLCCVQETKWIGEKCVMNVVSVYAPQAGSDGGEGSVLFDA
jgi:hypothetical protein